MAMTTKRLQAHRGTGVDQLHLTIPVPTTTAINTTFTVTENFERPFEEVPRIIGSNVPKPGAAAGITVTKTSVTVTLRSQATSVYSAENVNVNVTLEGRVL